MCHQLPRCGTYSSIFLPHKGRLRTSMFQPENAQYKQIKQNEYNMLLFQIVIEGHIQPLLQVLN